MVDIILERPGDGEIDARRVVHGDRERLAHGDPGIPRQRGVEQHALLRPGDGPAVLMQVDGLRDGGVVRRNDVDLVDAAGRARLIGRGVHKDALRHLVRIFFAEGLLLRLVHGRDERDGNLIVRDATELIVHDGGDGIAQAEARNDEGRAAADAQQHHKQALFIAHDIADGDLVQEGQAVPYERDILEQDALAGLRGLRAHEIRGVLAQLRMAGKPRHACRAGQRRQHGDDEQPAVEHIDDGRKVI